MSPARNWIGNGVTVVLVGCALMVTALVARRELRGTDRFPASTPDRTAYPPTVRVDNWVHYGTGAWIGSRQAPVRIVEFSDFQCSFCRILAERLATVQARHPDAVAIVYRHFPLPSHPQAADAARASVCADRQERFAAMHDALFAAQPALGDAPWTEVAMRAGVPDTAAFARCLRAPATDSVLARDRLAAQQLGVVATPTLLINDMRLVGAVPLDTLDVYVARALRERATAAARQP